jgi:hypothetical protein
MSGGPPELRTIAILVAIFLGVVVALLILAFVTGTQ